MLTDTAKDLDDRAVESGPYDPAGKAPWGEPKACVGGSEETTTFDVAGQSGTSHGGTFELDDILALVQTHIDSTYPPDSPIAASEIFLVPTPGPPGNPTKYVAAPWPRGEEQLIGAWFSVARTDDGLSISESWACEDFLVGIETEARGERPEFAGVLKVYDNGGGFRCYSEFSEGEIFDYAESVDVDGFATLKEAIDDFWAEEYGGGRTGYPYERLALVESVDAKGTVTYADVLGNTQLSLRYEPLQNETWNLSSVNQCSNGPNRFVDGPVLRSPPPPPGELEEQTAEVQGTLVLEDGCLLLGPGDDLNPELRYPPIWPAGTTWQSDPPGVVLGSGEVVLIGEAVYGGGGYPQGVNLNWDALVREFAIACAGPTGEVAVFNPGGDIELG